MLLLSCRWLFSIKRTFLSPIQNLEVGRRRFPCNCNAIKIAMQNLHKINLYFIVHITLMHIFLSNVPCCKLFCFELIATKRGKTHIFNNKIIVLQSLGKFLKIYTAQNIAISLHSDRYVSKPQIWFLSDCYMYIAQHDAIDLHSDCQVFTTENDAIGLLGVLDTSFCKNLL